MVRFIVGDNIASGVVSRVNRNIIKSRSLVFRMTFRNLITRGDRCSPVMRVHCALVQVLLINSNSSLERKCFV